MGFVVPWSFLWVWVSDGWQVVETPAVANSEPLLFLLLSLPQHPIRGALIIPL